MSYETYKVLHLIAILFLFMSFGTLAAIGSQTGGSLRKIASIAHGVALLVIFVAGFGLMARLGMFGSIPGWAWAKIAIWVIAGGLVMPLKRKPEWAPALWVALPLLGGVAAWMAVAKPF